MLHIPLLLPCLLLHDPLDTLFQRVQLLRPTLWLMSLLLLKFQIFGSLRLIPLLRLHILELFILVVLRQFFAFCKLFEDTVEDALSLLLLGEHIGQ